MNIYSLPSYITVIINILLGVYIFRKNPKKAENILFAFLALGFVVWNFGEGTAMSATSAQDAMLWSRIEWIGVSFLGPLFLHLALSFPEKKKILQNKWALLAIYLPGFIVLYVAWATDLIVAGTETTFWAKYSQIHDRTAFGIYGLYFEAILFIGLYLFWKIYRTSDREIEKKQAKYMLIATAIPIIGGSVSNVILPVLGFHVFPVAGSLTAIMAAIIAYAIIEHRLMSLVPLALENVVNGIVQGVIISDAFGRIVKVNSSAGQILGIKPDAVGQKFEAAMQPVLPRMENAKEFEQLMENANKRPDEISSAKIVLNASDKKFLDVSISPVKDEKGGIIGQVTIFYDITGRKESEEELKKLNQELQSKVAELKRFNDIAVGRELKMIELKKRIRELEAKK